MAKIPWNNWVEITFANLQPIPFQEVEIRLSGIINFCSSNRKEPIQLFEKLMDGVAIPIHKYFIVIIS
jgi:hypothetical protein